MSLQEDMILSIASLLALGAVAAFSYYRGTREHTSIKPRLVPWVPIALGCMVTALMVFIHLVNLLGFQTGGGMPGR